MATKKKFRIPGLTFSWKRALGITRLKQAIARKTGIHSVAGLTIHAIAAGLVSLDEVKI